MIRVEVVSESQLSRRDLGAFDVVVLCNVAQFSQAEVTALDDFLKQGGGVVVFGGDQVIPENYNRLLYADGKGILPAAIGADGGRRGQEGVGLRLQPAGLPPPARGRIPRRVGPGHRRPDAGPDVAVSQADPPTRLGRPGRAGLRDGRSRRHRGAAASRPGDPGRHLGRRRLDDLAPAQELSPDHAADGPPGGGGPAGRAEHPGRPALRPVVRRRRRVGRRHGGHAQGPADRGQAESRRRRQPAPLRADGALGTLPGQDRAAAGTRNRVRGQPGPRRERSREARSSRASRSGCPAGTSSTSPTGGN